MTVRGLDALTQAAIEVGFDQGITGVDPILGTSEETTYLAPGWIDLQVNGFAGVDFNDPSSPIESIGRATDALFATGVTRFFPTVITGSAESMQGSLRNLARARAALPNGAAMEGFHVEGPHICPDDGPRGAHPVAQVRPPDQDEFHRLQEAADGHIRLVTLSPEYSGSVHYIEAVTRLGVVVSIGHTKATGEQISAAVSAGATMSTHLGNGAHAVLPRHPNYLWDQLAEDRLAACFIVDGIHLSDTFLKVALRAKGLDRSVLVTDAVMPADCPPGRYRLGELDVELQEDQRVVLAGGTRLAGSSLRMDRGIENLMRRAGVSLRDAVVLATRNPARVGRVVARQRGLVPGERADLVRFEFDPKIKSIRVTETYLSGRQVYRA